MTRKLQMVMIALAIMLFAAVPSFSQEIEVPTSVGYVNDYANILSPEQKATMEAKLKQYDQQTGIQIAVITMPSLKDRVIEDWTLAIGRKWNVGGAAQTGVVFMVAPTERKGRIEPTRHLEGDMTDGQAGTLLRQNVVPLTKQEKWPEAVIAGVNAITEFLGPLSRPERDALRQKQAKEEAERIQAAWTALPFVVGFMALLGIGVYFIWFRKRARYSVDTGFDSEPISSRHSYAPTIPVAPIRGRSYSSPRRQSDIRPSRRREEREEPDYVTPTVVASVFDSEPTTSRASTSDDNDVAEVESPFSNDDFGDFGSGGATADL